MPADERLSADQVQALARLALAKRTHGGVQAHADYQGRPLDWIVEHLDVDRASLEWSLHPAYEDHEWDGDEDPFVQAFDALVDHEDVGIEAATGVGKTYWLACLIYWFLACFEDALVVTAAPKEDQLLKHVWKEAGRLWPRFQRHFPQANMQTGHIAMIPGAENKERWSASAFVCGVGADEEVATKAQGWHAEHMLIITEETPGIHGAIMRAFQNTRTAPHNLQVSVGNPDHREDELHRFCLQPNTRHLRVSALDYPNVVADDPTLVEGAVSTKKVEERKILYANQPALYQSRVRGISPSAAFGVALNFREADHLESKSLEEIRHHVTEQGWKVWSAVDLGHWRNCWGAALSDRTGRLHVVDEHFCHDVETKDLAAVIHERLEAIAAPPKTRIVTDRKSPHDVKELNRAFRKLDSPYRAVPALPADKQRSASVRRINDLLGDRALLFRRELGEGQEWRLGLSRSNQGDPREGSRLFWELKNWRYPEPREGQAQKEDPDDDTADGADAIAMLRYLVMSWWRKAGYAVPDEKPDPNLDTGYDAFLERAEKARQKRERLARIEARR